MEFASYPFLSVRTMLQPIWSLQSCYVNRRPEFLLEYIHGRAFTTAIEDLKLNENPPKDFLLVTI